MLAKGNADLVSGAQKASAERHPQWSRKADGTCTFRRMTGKRESPGFIRRERQESLSAEEADNKGSGGD